MMKKLYLLLSLGLLPLIADEFFSFIGIDAGYQKVQLDPAYNTKDTTHTAVGLRIGTQTRKFRGIIELENGNRYRAFDISVDAIPFDELFGTPKVRPYIGLSATVLNYDNESLEDSDGYGFGGHVGVLIYAGEKVDIDLSYRYSTINQIDGVDTIQGVRLGIHYFY